MFTSFRIAHTCFIFLVNLFKLLGEPELSGWSSTGFSTVKVEPLDAFRAVDFDLLPVMPDCVETLGVLITNDERDLSFLLAGNANVAVCANSGAFIFILL